MLQQPANLRDESITEQYSTVQYGTVQYSILIWERIYLFAFFIKIF